MKKYNYEKGEVAWLKNSVKDGLPTEAVEILNKNKNALIVYKTKESVLNKFEVQSEDLINAKDCCKMSDLKTKN